MTWQQVSDNTIISIAGTHSNKSDHEEPHSQDPKEQSSNKSQSADEFAVQEAVALQIKILRKGVRHTNKCQASERGWPNSDEHGTTMLTIWVSNLHEATNIMSIHENGNRESETLTSEPRNNNGVSGSQRLVDCDDGSNSS